MNFPFLPGVATASDILKLLDLEYKYFKFFPAVAAGGIEYINSLKGPFPEIMSSQTQSKYNEGPGARGLRAPEY